MHEPLSRQVEAQNWPSLTGQLIAKTPHQIGNRQILSDLGSDCQSIITHLQKAGRNLRYSIDWSRLRIKT